MTALQIVFGLLGEFVEPFMRLVEAGTSADRIREGLAIGLQAASTVARERIEARNGGPVDSGAVLAMHTRDLAKRYKAAGHGGNALSLERIAESVERDARSEDDTARVSVPPSSR